VPSNAAQPRVPRSPFLANVWFADHSGVDAMFVNTSAFSGTDPYNLLDRCRDSAA
jgi:hypothetical protein